MVMQKKNRWREVNIGSAASAHELFHSPTQMMISHFKTKHKKNIRIVFKGWSPN